MSAKSTPQKKVCKEGHVFFKSSDCPTCPICEATGKPGSGFLALLSAPARRALTNQGIITIGKLSEFTEKEILKLHGMGPATIPILKEELTKAGLSFQK